MLATLVLATSVLLQAVAAALALRLIRIPGGRTAGLTLAAALTLMVARRAVVLFEALRAPAAHPPHLEAELIGLAISALMVVGVVAVAPLFRGRREATVQALRDSEHRLQQLMPEFRALLDAIPDNLTLQARDLTIRWANRGAALGLGREPDELIGKRCHELWQGSDQPCPRCPVQRAYRSGRTESDVMSTPDGRAWELRAVPIVDRQGALTGVVEVGRNITDLRNLEAQLLQAQKMEAVGRLAGGIAHDFNNLLSAILGYAEMLRLRLEADEQAREDVDGIRHTVEQAAALTRQLLAFSRKQVVRPRVIDLNEIVGAAQPLLCRLLGEDVTVRAALAPEPVLVNADPGQLEQVLLNLAVNARDAMPSGGTLTLTVTETRLEADEAARLELPPGRHVVLAVRDTGGGIPPAVRSRMFEPFFTTKPNGTGLGLSITLGIVKEYGGAMVAESPPEGGAVFRIHLPTAEGTPERPTGRFRVDARGPRGTETVLLVEDDLALRRLTRAALTSHGYQVLDAGDAVDGLALAEGHAGPLELLVTDVVLPRGNGLELAERVRARRPEIRVLYVSGYTADTALPLGAEHPRSAFLQKPFGPEDLARRVRRLLDEL